MTATIYQGDCVEVMASLEPGSVDTCITDPPYGLGFMGRGWDHGVPGVRFWEMVLRLLKPGGMLLAFGGTRTYHRLACAIEDAGFEIRDSLMWLYGSGFPKSLDISKAIDSRAGATREVTGSRELHDIRKASLVGKVGTMTHNTTAPATDLAKIWDGWGTALKPAYEPIVLAMKPLDGTFAANAEKHGVAGVNVDGCRVGTSKRAPGSLGYGGGRFGIYGEAGGKQSTDSGQNPNIGRWPANVILSPEAGKLLDQQREGASRFLYSAKASRSEKTCAGSVDCKHPTVKPLALMRWLVRLTATPTGGVVLDPFMGSGSTGVACIHEERPFVGIELEADSCQTAKERLEHAAASADRQIGLDL